MKFKRIIRNMYKNLKVTYKQKMLGALLILAGMAPIWIENDGTFMIFALILGVPMLTSKDVIIHQD